MMTHVGEQRVSGDQPSLACVPKVIGTFYMRAHSMKKDTHVLRGDQTDMRRILSGLTTNADARYVCG